MDQLRELIRTNRALLGDQPEFENLIEQLDEPKAAELAKKLAAFLRGLATGETSQTVSATLH